MRIVILSDVHSNIVALETVLADAGSFDALWCLGDTIGYGPAPNECVELIRHHAAITLTGNHDLACLGKISLNDFNPDAGGQTSGMAPNSLRLIANGCFRCRRPVAPMTTTTWPTAAHANRFGNTC